MDTAAASRPAPWRCIPVMGRNTSRNHGKPTPLTWGSAGLLLCAMPFADEKTTVAVIAYRPSWPDEFATIAAGLRTVVGGLARAIDHVGSTSVPELPAKDCIDIQVRVDRIDHAQIVPPLTAAGFRQAWTPPD